MTAVIAAPNALRLPLIDVSTTTRHVATPLRVVVLGNGLGGLALARALHSQGMAVDVTVLERPPRPAPDRHGLAIAPNGLNALASMGLLGQVVASGQRLRAIEVIPKGYDRGARFEFERLAVGENLAVGLLPSTLRRILLQDLGGTTRVLHGHKLVDVEFSGEHAVKVVTEVDGRRQEYAADLVVGADGVRSSLRRHVTTEVAQVEVDEAYQVILGDAVPGLDSIQQHVGRGRLLGMVPLESTRTFVFWLSRRNEVSAIRGQPLSAFKDELVAHTPSVEPALASLTSWDQVFSTEITLTRCSKWHRGNVVLMGDTVHATTPSLAQGASMSLVDAVCLARAIAAWSAAGRRRGDVEAYLARFVALRQRQTNLQHVLGQWAVRSSITQSRTAQLAKLSALGLLSLSPGTARWTLNTISGLWPRASSWSQT